MKLSPSAFGRRRSTEQAMVSRRAALGSSALAVPRIVCFQYSMIPSSHPSTVLLLDRGQWNDAVNQRLGGIRLGQVQFDETSMIVVTGEDNEVLAEEAPAALLRLMSQYEDASIQKQGHRAQHGLAMTPTPGQEIGGTGSIAVIQLQLPVEDAGIES